VSGCALKVVAVHHRFLTRPVRTCLLVGVVAIVLAGCNMWYRVDPYFTAATISTGQRDVFLLGYNATSGTVDVSAPAENTDSNNRGAFWPEGQTPTRDGETCARWKSENHGTNIAVNIQEGVALRVRNNVDGSLDAITVTRDVWLGAPWVFNVNMWHVVDTYHPGLTSVLGANLRSAFGNVPNLPWSICAKVVGAKLSFIVWARQNQPKPEYGDATHGGTVTLPSNYVYIGHIGWYAGHLAPGQSVDYDHLQVTPL
jgi:hypothetical protein